ncbi:hypothetical protein P7H46_06635 [Enterococcus pseudoavium]|uniref:Uncharacterized protein n=1 Tax=Enterococcus pseudoavium TaxID=44007 RepID=A0ABU3FID7_9ENTE|nr:hypothetical protein [Enterococcus pseudoavium]MDT2770520.1 hypothetical protein [Enterococcus pseudoavium]DAN95129.1 MAG TPA: hypothetical protein [Caudoviricetes sp.]
MAIKTDVFSILDARIEILERKVEWFEKFGNRSKTKEVLEHVIAIERLSELKSVKSDLEYSVHWQN